MELVRNRKDLAAALSSLRTKNKTLGLVPTMGALHRGHAALMETCRKNVDFAVLSIFVNPTQFAPGEDFEKYPRTFEADLEVARECGMDLVFAPSVDVVYPAGFSTFVEETALSKVLCGAFRPGHFRGVCTVVHQLFQLVRPSVAYFGFKDAQQLRVIEKMVDDLKLEIQIVGCPTVRENDGVALSSRNTYLSPEERNVAPKIYRSLQAASARFAQGERKASEIISAAREILSTERTIQPQYVELRTWRDFSPVSVVTEPALLAIAAFLGKTRLIDNVFLKP